MWNFVHVFLKAAAMYFPFFSFLLSPGWNAWNKLGTAMLKLDERRSQWMDWFSAPQFQDPSPFCVVAWPYMAITLLCVVSFVILKIAEIIVFTFCLLLNSYFTRI